MRRNWPKPFAVAAATCSSSHPAAPEGDLLVRHRVAHIGGQQPPGQPLAPRHPDARIELAPQPSGKADMVGMKMGADHPPRPPHRQRLRLEQRTPGIDRRLDVQPGVDDRRRIAIGDQPAINMIERPRHRDAHPMHAGRNRNRFPHRRRALAQRIGQPAMTGRDEAVVLSQRDVGRMGKLSHTANSDGAGPACRVHAPSRYRKNEKRGSIGTPATISTFNSPP